MIFWSERENLPLANTAASLTRLLIHTLISLPACQLDGYSYQVEKGFFAQVRLCQSLLSVSKLMVTKISSVHFLFPLRVLKLKMLKLSNLNMINDNSKLLSVSSPVTSTSDVFYTVAENIKLKERFSPPPHSFLFAYTFPFLIFSWGRRERVVVSLPTAKRINVYLGYLPKNTNGMVSS